MAHTNGGTVSLEQEVGRAGSPVALLKSSQVGPYTFPVIPAEFTNWRLEQRAWKESVALLELSYHMTELRVKGPGALNLLARLGVNRFDRFPVLKAKQLVLAAEDGNMIGDAILFREADEFYRIVGAPFASDWVEYQAQAGGDDVEIVRDDNLSIRTGDRDVYRIQVQGPNALPLMREASDGTLPEIGFFSVGEFRIGNTPVRALRHGMAGEPGFEIYGPWADQQAIRETLERIGAAYGLRKVGALAYSSTGQVSGWMPMPVPAIYTGEAMRPYRDWLTNRHLETVASLGGSFASERIEDYYVDPIEVGYGGLIDFNHDFIGREALVRRKEDQRRHKVTLVWNPDDCLAIMRDSLFGTEDPARYLAMPNPMYATFQCDAVVKDGRTIGISQWPCYTANAQTFISLAVADMDAARIGETVTILWGEPDSRRATVEPNRLREIRATVAPAPFVEKVIKTGRQ